MKYFLLHLVGSVYETVTFLNFTLRLVRRKIGNMFRGESRRSWEDCRVSKPSVEECQRLNDEAERSV
jgi:hypothetical protein